MYEIFLIVHTCAACFHSQQDVRRLLYCGISCCHIGDEGRLYLCEILLVIQRPG